MSIEFHVDVRGFFHERVSKVIKHRDIQKNEYIEFYLVDLLAQFAFTAHEALLTQSLVDLLIQAESSPASEKLKRYRELGDFALFIAGFFNDHLERRGVSRSYAIDMGGNAYANASALAALPGRSDQGLPEVFRALAQDFDDYANVLDDVREQTQMRTPQEVVKLYERWLRTESPVLAQRLEQEGVFPQLPTKDPKGGAN